MFLNVDFPSQVPPGRRWAVPWKRAILSKALAASVLLGLGLVAVGPAPDASAANFTGSVPAGTSLRSGDTLYSPSGQFRLVVQSDGNSVVYSANDDVLWSTGKLGGATGTLRPQADGNLVRYSSANVPLWQSGTFGSASRLAMQDDGNLVMYSTGNTAIWSAQSRLDRLLPGQTLKSGWMLSTGSAYGLVMQTDGNLVLYQNGVAMWQTMTNGNPGARLVLQTDGNAVVYSTTDRPLWQTGTRGLAPDRFVVQNDGNVVLYKAGGGYSWNRMGFPQAGSGLRVPTTGVVTGNYAPRHCDGSGSTQHTGIDIAASARTPIYAAASGAATSRDTGTTGFGKSITITHSNGYSTLYGHMSGFAVGNQTVAQGQLIGYVGNTGASRGNHVHMELRLNGAPQSSMNGYFPCGQRVTAGSQISGSFPGLP